VVIPAQGIVEFRDALTKLLDEFDAHEDGEKFIYDTYGWSEKPLFIDVFLQFPSVNPACQKDDNSAWKIKFFTSISARITGEYSCGSQRYFG